MGKSDAILLGPCVGELYWELARFAPMLPYMKAKQYKDKDITYVILTREDRFDIYGKFADILVPLRIKGDGDKYLPDCFKLQGFPFKEVEKLARKFKAKYEERFRVITHVYPDLPGHKWQQKNQFPQSLMKFKFKPRGDNLSLVEEHIPNSKPLIVLAPRFRNGFRRNWPHWQKFYDKVWDSELKSKYTFVICGKPSEYVPDKEGRFYDINKIPFSINASLIGLTIEVLKRASLTVGSQSAIPNISLLLKVPALEWGHQKDLHTGKYNIRRTHVEFITDRKYKLEADIVFNKMTKMLKNLG